VGYDQDKTLGAKETGGHVAAPIWHDFMAEALRAQPVNDFPVPDDVILVNIDQRSGLRAGPGTSRPLLEAFKRGTEPTVVAGAAPEADSDADDVAAASVSATTRPTRDAPGGAEEPSSGF
jgi:penicillin-binding protein 1A